MKNLTVSKDLYESLNEATSEESKDAIATVVETPSAVESEFPLAETRENDEFWFLNLGTGLGFAQYAKKDFTLDEAAQNELSL